MTPEGQVKEQVKQVLALHKDGVYAYWPVPNGYGASTVDCLVCAYGHFIAIETKAPGKKPTPAQTSVLERVQDAGGSHMVIDGPQGVLALQGRLEGLQRIYGRKPGGDDAA